MYDELVNQLRNRRICVQQLGTLNDDPLLGEAADAIEELSKPKWIPVTERLPEFDQKVLAWVKNKDQEGRFNKDGIYTAELKDKVPKPDPEGKRNFWGIPGYDSVWTVWSWSYFTEPDVLFWMPLPEPPKEE